MKKLAVVSSRQGHNSNKVIALHKNPEDSSLYIKNDVVVDVYDPQTNTTERVCPIHDIKEFYLIGDIVEYDDELKIITGVKNANPKSLELLMKINEYYKNYFLKSRENSSVIALDENIQPLDRNDIILIMIGISSVIFDIKAYNGLIRVRNFLGGEQVK